VAHRAAVRTGADRRIAAPPADWRKRSGGVSSLDRKTSKSVVVKVPFLSSDWLKGRPRMTHSTVSG
jgi:hypothetical protein